MSPISPFVTGGGQNNWPKSDWPDVQIPDHNEKCPICGNILVELFSAIGGFPGHEFVHRGSLIGYNCLECMRPFSLEEILLIKEKKMREKTCSDFVRNYWKNVCAVFRNPYLYIIVVMVALLDGLLVGITAGVVLPFLVPFLAKGIEIVFTPLCKLARKILFPDKSPDDPKTP